MNIINEKEKKYLRELAKEQLEYANLPKMKELENAWYTHNDAQSDVTMVVMEDDFFISEMIPKLQCESKLGQQVEKQLLSTITAHKEIGDDRVIPNVFEVPVEIDINWCQNPNKLTFAEDGLGYHIEPILECLEEDLIKINPSIFKYDDVKTNENIDFLNETIGDILPVKKINTVNRWSFAVTEKIVQLMGMENMFCSMITEPEEFLKLMNLLTNDLIRLLRWEEENNLLFMNNGNDRMGSGNYCFTNQLSIGKGASVKSINTWGHLNSQECVGVSPELFNELVFPTQEKIAKEFGRIYYGCCEPVSDFWEKNVKNIPNIAKVSISPWCDQQYMADRLEGTDIIYSRKPSPNFLGIEKAFDENSFRKHIRETMDIAKNCRKEFIFRDIYALNGNSQKIKRAVEIVREETNK